MIRNNKGFSLVELIIAFAIAAIAGLSIYGMMSVSGNIFRKTNNDVGLQYEQQVVINQIRDYVLESSNAIYYDEAGSALYVFKQDRKTTPSGVENSYEISKLTFVSAGTTTPSGDLAEVGRIYSNSKVFDHLPTTDEYMNDSDLKSLGEAFGENVKEIKYDLSEVKNNKFSFEITFEEDGKEFNSVQVVSLRNRVIDSKDLSKVFSTVIQNSVDSYIQYIGIKRLDGDDEYTNGQADSRTIGTIFGQEVKVKYKALVHTKVASERNYRVTWSVEGVKFDGANETSVALTDDIVSIAFDSNNEATLTVKKAPQESLINGVSKYDYLYLKCSSIDEPDKECRIKVNVDNNGNYPKPSNDLVAVRGSTLVCDQTGENVHDTNGVREYSLCPRIEFEKIYGDTGSNIVENDDALKLIDYWKVECFDSTGAKADLPVGKESGIVSRVNLETGKFSLTEEANGWTIKISFKVRQRDRNGDEVWSNVVVLTPTDIPPFSVGTKLEIVCNDTINRAGEVNPAINWSGVTNLKNQMRYFWKIVPYDDNSSSKFDTMTNNSFNSMVKLGGSNVNQIGGELSSHYSSFTSVNGTDLSGWYYTQLNNRIVKLNVDEYLDWNNNYKIKVLVFGVSLKQESIGSNNFFIDRNESKIFDRQGEHGLDMEIVPVEFIVTAPKVTMQLTKIDDFNRTKQNYNSNFKPALASNMIFDDSIKPNVPEENKYKNMRAYQIGWTGIEFSKVSSGYYPDLVFYDTENKEYKADNAYSSTWNASGEFSGQHKGYAFYIDTRKSRWDNDNTAYQRVNPYCVDLSFKCNTHGYTIKSDETFRYTINYSN